FRSTLKSVEPPLTPKSTNWVTVAAAAGSETVPRKLAGVSRFVSGVVTVVVSVDQYRLPSVAGAPTSLRMTTWTWQTSMEVAPFRRALGIGTSSKETRVGSAGAALPALKREPVWVVLE